MSERRLRRFETEKEARDCARMLSERDGSYLYVVESPPGPEEGPLGRFVVDTDGFTRNWERSVAAYENGEEVRS